LTYETYCINEKGKIIDKKGKRLAKNIKSLMRLQRIRAKSNVSKFFTAQDNHSHEPGYVVPDDEAIMHFSLNSSGARDFRQEFDCRKKRPWVIKFENTIRHFLRLSPNKKISFANIFHAYKPKKVA